MSCTLSQIGVLASVTVTPLAGDLFGGGEPGLGFLSASIDANGHLQLLRTDGVVFDAGKIGRVVAEISAAGIDASTGTLLTADISLVVATSPGGVCVLPGSGQNLERKVINMLSTPVVICVPGGSRIDANAPGAPVQVPGNASVIFASTNGVLWASS
jgi:hypothetical protein